MDAWIGKSLEAGAIGVKILGGHWPVALETEATLVEEAVKCGSYIAWHAGSDTAGSNIEGVREVVRAIGNAPLRS